MTQTKKDIIGYSVVILWGVAIVISIVGIFFGL